MEEVDVVIIGSGYGGSIPAARLAEAGMSVVVLERGLRRETADLRQSDDPVWITKVVDLVVSSSNIGYRTGKMMGGASINMDGAHFRNPQHSFEVTDASGRPYWPEGYSRAALDPWYDLTEPVQKIRQLTWPEIPKAGGIFGKMLDAAGASCDLARFNYTNCLQCGFCSVGCIYDKKMTMMHNYIPMAEAAGADFRAQAYVDHLEPSGTGYNVFYERGGEPQTIFGQRVFVAGGGIHSAALLLRSKPWLPDLSAQTGENFNNNGEHAFIGILPPEFDDLDRYHVFKGMENGGLMSYHWYYSDGFTLHPGSGMEPNLLSGNFAAADHPVLPKRSWGLEYKRFVEAVYPHRIIAFSVLGLADGHTAITVKGDGNPDIVKRDRTAYDAYLDRLDEVMAEITAKTGVHLIPAVPRELAGTTAAHLMCACRMADTKEHGVVDANCEVFGYENLYCCDASAIPYAMAVNPALTISALAEKTAAYAIDKG